MRACAWAVLEESARAISAPRVGHLMSDDGGGHGEDLHNRAGWDGSEDAGAWLSPAEQPPREPNAAAPLPQALPGYEARVARRDYSLEEKARRAELRRQAAEARRRGPSDAAAASAGGTGEAPVWPPSFPGK